jgi:hypothetical protein
MSYPGWRWDGTQWQRVPVAKKSHTGLVVTLSIVGGLLLLCIGGIAVASTSGDSTTSSGESEAGGAPQAEPDGTPDPLPTVGRDGQFEFTLQSVETGPE